MTDSTLKVLVVDDYSTMRRIIKGILRQLGYSNVDEAEDGTDALIKMHQERYGLLVTDWNMPHMTGIDLVRTIRADSELKDIPILMVTAEAKKENVKAALEAGVNNYVVKPFTQEILKSKIEKIFESMKVAETSR